ncbi:hypothetical protein FB45DRAFT_889608 [Roridomyces roridus]|uniref:Xylosidase/arabinosidase n=1 Tax=Roridomyces roridus TaxID=1738132 RepID=A0AAD7CKI0_9AGAR|nr:hypothetical protein FB45DRAFT_889608 [Roridomyces roridus]
MPTAQTSAAKVLKRAVQGTIHDKFLVGYQGWFTCGGDGPPIGDGHHGWLHWVNEPISPPFHGRPNTDLWPDTTDYESSELYTVAGLAHRDGSPAKVFSSRDPRTVRRHFRWMAEHGVDGAFLQRFVGQVDPEDEGNRDVRFGGTRRLRDEIGQRVREAAEAEGRVWAVMYDVSGVPADKIARIISQDYAHLVHELRIFDSPAYLRERGRPVVGIWGFGLSDSPVSPSIARAVFDTIRSQAGQDVYIFAGTPSHWRTPGEGDAHADPQGEWARLWLGGEGAVDAISPWSVGRFGNAVEVEGWARERWGPDAERVDEYNQRGIGRRVDYVPVVLPGGSGFNLSEGKWGFNNIKRDGGKFLWSQIFAATRLKGVRTLYGAMWDEYDEGTAFLPVVPKKRLLPESERWPFLALDEDGYDLPPDWYMRIAGFAAEALRSERRVFDSFPSKELGDYWGGGKRPRYEEEGVSSSASGSAVASASGLGYGGAGSRTSVGSAAAVSVGVTTATTSAPAPTQQEDESERLAREAKAQYDAWVEEQRKKEEEGEDAPPPAYSLEDEGPQQPVQVPVQPTVQQPVQQQQPPVQRQQSPPVQQRPVPAPPLQQSPPPQQQRPVPQPPVQQQQSFQPVQQQDAAIGALASDFARQSSIHGSQDVSSGVERPPLHPAQAGRVGSYDSGRNNSSGSVERPPLHPSHPSAGRMSSVGPQQQSGTYQQQQQHTGGSASSSSSVGPQEPQQGYQQSGTYPGGSTSSSSTGGYGQYPQGPSAPTSPQPAPGSLYTHPDHSGRPASSAYDQQGPYRQQQQHTGGSSPSGGYASPPHGHSAPTSPQPAQASSHYGPGYQQHAPPPGPPSASSYNPPRPSSAYPGQAPSAGYAPPPGRPDSSFSPRPASAYPDQASTSGYAPPAGPPPSQNPQRPWSAYPGQTSPANQGPGLGHSASLSARPYNSGPHPNSFSPPQPSLRPESAAPRPTTPGGFASYPAPSGPPPNLAPRPESARPTTPGYGPPPHHAQPPHNHSHHHHPPPGNISIPSPEVGGPMFPMGPASPPMSPHQPYNAPYAPYGNPSFPAASPPAGAPSFPPGPSFPQNDNQYFYQQPQQQFPGAGYSPPQPDPYNNYAQQQGSWPMPHQAGYGQPVSYASPGGGPQGFPSPSTSAGSFAFADKFVGRRTREQLEGAVDKVSQSSSKLLGKFL